MLAVVVVALVTFGILFCIDKGFTKLFRSKQQHKSGLSVRLRKGYAVGGLLVCILGILALMQLATEFDKLMLLGGILLLIVGIALIVYYMSFGIYYDDDSFLLSTFGKKSTSYRYEDIVCQQLYTSAGGVLIELFMKDGRNVGLQATMEGIYPFLDKACHARMRQLGLNSAECEWFDPDNSKWFPTKED